LNSSSVLKKLEFIDHRTNQHQPFESKQKERDMVYEILEFNRIIEENDQEKYRYLQDLSAAVLSITEEARIQNNIVFDIEKR
jgi:hypothetical protein